MCKQVLYISYIIKNWIYFVSTQVDLRSDLVSLIWGVYYLGLRHSSGSLKWKSIRILVQLLQFSGAYKCAFYFQISKDQRNCSLISHLEIWTAIKWKPEKVCWNLSWRWGTWCLYPLLPVAAEMIFTIPLPLVQWSDHCWYDSRELGSCAGS